MHSYTAFLYFSFAGLLLVVGCVDPIDSSLSGTVDVVVVDGRLTDLNEPQLVRINHSKADPYTGRFGTTPLAKATVEIVVDSSVVISFHETDPGHYQAPDGFVGQIGHSYQLRFRLSDGKYYTSTTETMQAVPTIDKVSARFNPTSLPPGQQLSGGYAAAHNLYVDWQDPASQHNYYRWDWILWERQDWCRTCSQSIYQIADDKGNLIEDCVSYRTPQLFQVFDYNCRTSCWEILYNSDVNILTDAYINGNPVTGWLAAQIPYYQHQACLVELRQSALTPTAYQYFKLLQTQSQKTGGLADTPPAAPIGNVRNKENLHEAVVGYFTASAVSSVRYWLDRKDATVLPLGATVPVGASSLTGAELFYALNQRQPITEVGVVPARYRPPLAVCVPSDSRTPVKPTGWLD